MTTENHKLNTPAEGSLNWDEPLNENFRIIDRLVEIRDTEANLDNYTPIEGGKFYATDSGRRFQGDGSQWVELPPQPIDDLPVPNRTSDPQEAVPGQLWYREDTNTLKIQLANEAKSLAAGSDGSTDSESGDSGDDSDSGTEEHKLTFEAADGADWDSYTAVIDGEIVDTFDLNSGDTITTQDDGTVLLEGGVMDGRSEGVYFTGTLVDLTLSLEGSVYLDGQEIDPSDY